MIKRHRRLLGWLVGVALLVGLLVWSGPSAWRQLWQADRTFWLPVLALTGLIQVLAAARWHFLLGHVIGSATPSFADVLHHTLRAAVVGLVSPSRDLGEMGTRIASVRVTHGLALGRVALSVLLDRSFDGLVVIAFVLGGLPALLTGWHRPWLLGGCYLLVLGLMTLVMADQGGPQWLLGGASAACRRLAAHWERIPFLRHRPRPENPGGLDDLLRAITPGMLLGAFGLTVVKYAAFVLRAFLVARAVGAAIPATAMLLAAPLSQVSLLLAVTPGGVGVTEMGWCGVLSLLGVSSQASASFVVTQRLLVTLSILVVATMGQVAFTVASGRRTHAIQDVTQ